jgi:hypothetical protein
MPSRDQFGIKFIDSLGRLHRAASGTAIVISGITRSSTTATATTSTVHGLVAGDSVTVAGVGESDYNGRFLVIAAPTTTTFTYTVANSPTTPATISGDETVTNNNYGPALIVTEGNFFQATKAYVLNEIVISKDAGGVWEHYVTTAGTSGSSEPLFPVSATTTVSGTVTFTTRAITGDVYYYNNGEIHRAGSLPAVKLSDGRLRYFENGRLHRTNGPAVMPASNSAAVDCEYYINGRKLNLDDIALTKLIVTTNSPAITATYS